MHVSRRIGRITFQHRTWPRTTARRARNGSGRGWVRVGRCARVAAAAWSAH